MEKKRLLILLILIFLCACTFIDRSSNSTTQGEIEDIFLSKFDEIITKAEKFASNSNKRYVKSVFQHQTDRVWKIEFSDGLVLLFDEETGEFEQFN